MGFCVSLLLRLGAGEPLFGIPGVLPYTAEDVTSGIMVFPFRTFAMLAGLVTISAVSRLTGTKWPPKQFN